MTNRKTDINGYIEIKDNPISKAGIYEYYGWEINAPDKDKLYRVLRSPEELSSPECIESFKGMPLINDHTMMGEGQKAPELVGIQGSIGDNVYFKNGVLYGNLRLYTNKIKGLIEKGKRDLSCGYWSTYDFIKGVWNGKPYDAIQRIAGANHIALVLDGRCGGEIAVLDHNSTKNRFNNLLITFDNKAVAHMLNEKQPDDYEDKDEDQYRDEDSVELPTRDDDIVESEEHEQEEMHTLQTLKQIIDDGFAALNARIDAIQGKKAPVATDDEEPEEDEEERKRPILTNDEDELDKEMEDKRKPEPAMDAKAIARSVEKELNQKAMLHSLNRELKIVAAIPAMDSSAKMAKYLADKAGLKCNEHTAMVALEAFATSERKHRHVTSTKDSKPNAQAKPASDKSILKIGAY